MCVWCVVESRVGGAFDRASKQDRHKQRHTWLRISFLITQQRVGDPAADGNTHPDPGHCRVPPTHLPPAGWPASSSEISHHSHTCGLVLWATCWPPPVMPATSLRASCVSQSQDWTLWFDADLGGLKVQGGSHGGPSSTRVSSAGCGWATSCCHSMLQPGWDWKGNKSSPCKQVGYGKIILIHGGLSISGLTLFLRHSLSEFSTEPLDIYQGFTYGRPQTLIILFPQHWEATTLHTQIFTVLEASLHLVFCVCSMCSFSCSNT